MPLITLAQCDRCQASIEVSDGYEQIRELGWVNLRAYGWCDARGNIMGDPDTWIVCPACRKDLSAFMDEIPER